jgi:hypothetical protein
VAVSITGLDRATQPDRASAAASSAQPLIEDGEIGLAGAFGQRGQYR